MSPSLISRNEPDRHGPTTAESRLSIRDLETALEQARVERNSEFAAVEDELVELSKIYERMRGDMQAVKEERDRAIAAVRDERERRARETLDLTERLEQAMQREDASRPIDAAALRERFVKDRLAAVPAERRKLDDDALPDVPGFEVVERTGHGGMAAIFRARRTSDGMPVALKLLHDGADASRARTELFLREAAVMLQLDHPGLVAAFDAGECSYGRYLAMEFVEGESLSSRTRRDGPVGEAEAVRVALSVARALAYCARLGLTHRDVKPSNVLIDHGGRLKLCDFGLAALSTGGDPARPYGSPGYASPEQLATPTDVDERADIYGLGCTLWHLVVGRRPFAGPAKQAFDEARSQDLPDPRFEGADISPRLAQVIRRMGRADRTKRYRRWDECVLDLMLVEKGNPPFAAHLADQRDPSSTGSCFAPDAPPPPPPAAEDPRAVPDTSTLTDSALPQMPAPPAPALPPAAAATESSTRERVPLRLAVACAVVTAFVLGFFAAISVPARPDDALLERARSLAAAGRRDDAVRYLREAARIAPKEAAERLRWEADALERR